MTLSDQCCDLFCEHLTLAYYFDALQKKKNILL